jgi:hypothetical protein
MRSFLRWLPSINWSILRTGYKKGGIKVYVVCTRTDQLHRLLLFDVI